MNHRKIAFPKMSQKFVYFLKHIISPSVNLFATFKLSHSNSLKVWNENFHMSRKVKIILFRIFRLSKKPKLWNTKFSSMVFLERKLWKNNRQVKKIVIKLLLIVCRFHISNLSIFQPIQTSSSCFYKEFKSLL